MVLSPSPPPRPVVLIVDDEPDILESLGDLFGAALDVDVRTAASGDAALDLLSRERVDLILSDFKMPGMNGLEFLEKAKALAPHVPRILMTAFPDLELAISAINEARIETFFTKPLDPDKVIAVVRRSLGDARAKGQRDQALARALDAARRKAGPGERGGDRGEAGRGKAGAP